MVLPGYAPGSDTVPALMSRGEAVLVPELVRQIGARNIIAANAVASGGRPGTVVGRMTTAMTGGTRSATSTQTAAMPGRIRAVLDGPRGGGVLGDARALGPLNAMAGEVSRLRADTRALGDILRALPVGITIEDRSGNPAETAQATRFALRSR